MGFVETLDSVTWRPDPEINHKNTAEITTDHARNISVYVIHKTIILVTKIINFYLLNI